MARKTLSKTHSLDDALALARRLYGRVSIRDVRSHDAVRMYIGGLALVVRQGLVLALTGSAIGMAGALLLSRLMSSQLYGVSPTDPITFVAMSVLLTLVALAACHIPARRAMQIDPMVALRYE